MDIKQSLYIKIILGFLTHKNNTYKNNEGVGIQNKNI